ncbi:hypothetical protein SFA35_08995 [Pseudomonas sp. HR96]|nr:hypothetical protein [Pseudomonas sp. HR96]WPP02349.1 hypothetical protein SFA35_08995 [Pseudomonas sp. HR96]
MSIALSYPKVLAPNKVSGNTERCLAGALNVEDSRILTSDRMSITTFGSTPTLGATALM